MRLLGILAMVLFAQPTPAASKGYLLLPDFETPPRQFSPKFRYWFPDATVPPEAVIQDVNDIAAVGAGGLEFLPFYNYGLGPALTDWSVYGFGTEAFKSILAAALNATASHGLKFDFALGPNQGAGVPSEVETLGLAKELVYGNTTLRPGDTFHGRVPEPNIVFNQLTGFMNSPELWGPSELVAVVAGRVLFEQLLAEYFYLSILEESSLVDLTNLTSGGNLTWTAPEGEGVWVIFGVYERYTNQRGCVSVANATTALGNGSWVVDHWSATGARKVTEFWDKQILSDSSIASKLAETGEYAWEDSMEMQAALPWTPELLTRFENLHGYSVVKYLPILFHATNAWHGYLPPYNVTYTLGGYPVDGGVFVQDYKTALSKGYVEYVTHYNAWASSKGWKLSNQPAYNMPIDMTEAVPHVQVPELESLGFSESIPMYRQFTGSAHLAKRNIISTEVGAVSGEAYKLRVPELKSLLDGSFAAGINTMVIHGYAYSGEYVGTTWPGYTPFQYNFAEMWNRRQPAWRHLDDLMQYAGRISMVLQTGEPKVDVAFYYFEIPYRFGMGVYEGADMNALGYSYEYLGPSNLDLEQAVVTDRILAADGPAFKALVIYNQTQITPEASEALISFAQGGLPIYIVGPMPNNTIGTQGQEEVSANIESLLAYDTVHVLTINEFSASRLAADGINARASIRGGSDASNLYTFWTSDSETGREYVYLNNRGANGMFDISFLVSSGHVPYRLDAWTGVQLPVVVYEDAGDRIMMRVDLKSNETTILAFSAFNTSALGRVHALNHSSNVKDMSLTSNGDLEAWVVDSREGWVTLSNGANLSFASSDQFYQENTTLGPWNLTIEAHSSSSNSDDALEGNITTIDLGSLEQLSPWTSISGVEQVSGIGTYLSTFDFHIVDGTAVMISFGPVLNTLRVWINGQQVPAIDPATSVADVSDLLITGPNSVKVEVTSSLFNSVKANIDRVFSIGNGPSTSTYYTEADWEDFGLIGPVRLELFRRVAIS